VKRLEHTVEGYEPSKGQNAMKSWVSEKAPEGDNELGLKLREEKEQKKEGLRKSEVRYCGQVYKRKKAQRPKAINRTDISLYNMPGQRSVLDERRGKQVTEGKRMDTNFQKCVIAKKKKGRKKKKGDLTNGRKEVEIEGPARWGAALTVLTEKGELRPSKIGERTVQHFV